MRALHVAVQLVGVVEALAAELAQRVALRGTQGTEGITLATWGHEVAAVAVSLSLCKYLCTSRVNNSRYASVHVGVD